MSGARDRSQGAARGVGRWTKTAISAQVAAATLLAALAAGLFTWIAARPQLRWRADLTALKTNTLDPTLAELIEKLPGRVGVEVFFRPLDPPLTVAGGEAQQRMGELLQVARNQYPDKLRVELHDLSDVARTSARMRELDLREDNVVVVTLGPRKVVLELRRDIARIDPGNPALRVEPSLESFHGEEALGTALLQVSVGETPRVLFTTGHGERELFDSESTTALGRLHSQLVADGFRVDRWDATREPELPAGARVLAIVDARQPFSSAELDAIGRFVDGGGRLFVATTVADEALGLAGSAEALLRRYGIEVATGRVAQPVPDGFGGWRQGLDQCAVVWVAGEGLDREHPITESLARSDGHVVLPGARALGERRETKPEFGRLIDVLRSAEASWRDLPNAERRHDWTRGPLEETGPFAVAMALAFAPPSGEGEGEGARRSSRIVAFTSPDALNNEMITTNRDFVLNAFNWLAARDERLVIRPRPIDRRLIDVRTTGKLSVLNAFATLGLPALCALLGVFVAWRRRK
jgi:hypothetical protein